MSLIFELLDFLSVRLNITTPSDFTTMTEKITGRIDIQASDWSIGIFCLYTWDYDAEIFENDFYEIVRATIG